MEELINVVNKLQDVFAQLGDKTPVNLPQLAVVGEQSSGKSSVLENFVGRDFLPRGTGIVTRRPLILQLSHTEGEEYGVFLHDVDKKITDFSFIRKMIEVETDRVTGSNKNISSLPINLKIYSPNVVNLTLVDLPGLTKIAVGDQPPDIDKQIRKMVSSFILNPNCLILAVTPANIDIANSESLKLAKHVDPEGNRTIGIITKIDLMDDGTDCRNILLNKVYPLRRGFVGVVNRSQKDIMSNKGINEAKDSEMKFFECHPSYCDLIDRIGCDYLQKTLSRLLQLHICNSIPDLSTKLKLQIERYRQQVDELEITDDSPESRNRIMIAIAQKFLDEVQKDLGFQNTTVEMNCLSVGSEINKTLTEDFVDDLNRALIPNENSRKDIMIAIRNAQGIRNTVYIPDVAFNTIVRRRIETLKPICLTVVEKIRTQMMRLIEKSATLRLKQFPKLKHEVLMLCRKFITTCESDAKQHIKILIDSHLCFVNTRHPDFMASRKNFLGLDENVDSPSSSDLSSKVFRKGYLDMSTNGIIKTYKTHWFVVRGDMLVWFKDDSEKELRNQVQLHNCIMRMTGSVTKRSSLMLSRKDSSVMAKDCKYFELYAETPEILDKWKEALETVGVQLAIDEDFSLDDPSLAKSLDKDAYFSRQVEMIKIMSNSYLKIIIKNLSDTVIKMVVLLVIEKLNEYAKSNMIAELYAVSESKNLLKLNPEDLKRRKDLLLAYNSCRDAANIVDELSSNLPREDIDVDLSFGQANRQSGSGNSPGYYKISRSSGPSSPVPKQSPIPPSPKPKYNSLKQRDDAESDSLIKSPKYDSIFGNSKFFTSYDKSN